MSLRARQCSCCVCLCCFAISEPSSSQNKQSEGSHLTRARASKLITYNFLSARPMLRLPYLNLVKIHFKFSRMCLCVPASATQLCGHSPNNIVEKEKQQAKVALNQANCKGSFKFLSIISLAIFVFNSKWKVVRKN